MMGTILQLSLCNSYPPRVMDASATNLIIQTCKDLGSIKFSFVNNYIQLGVNSHVVPIAWHVLL
jgi:hypothetical protein